MKETFYFSHDYHARSDTKIVKLLQKEKLEGYGIFWSIVEMLYENDGYIDKDYESIAFELRTECERIQRVVEDYGLFQSAGKKITSKSVEHRLRLRKGKSEQARQSAVKRWTKEKQSNANALQTQSDGNAIKESKVNEIKENNIITDDVYMQAGHLSITHDEFSKLEKEYGGEKADEVVQSILNYRKNTKYKSLYLTARTWLKRDKKKLEEPVRKVEVTTDYSKL